MKVLLELLKEFQMEQLDKFVKRISKYSENSVTYDTFDWGSQSLEDSEHHLICEFLERFPQFIDRFPEVDVEKIGAHGVMEEDVDIANLAFYDWAIRKKRQTK
jgi:hypothetical protein